MAVYKRRDNQNYEYDVEVQYRGLRFRDSGDTEQATERGAKAVERQKKVALKNRAIAEGGLGKKSGNANLTLREAFDLWWKSKAKALVNAHDLKTSFEGVIEPFLGGDKKLNDIDDGDVQRLINHRAAQYRWGKPKCGLITPAQVNRTTIDVLSPIMYMARKTWKCPLPNMPDFGELTLKEPEARVREMTDEEYALIKTNMGIDYLEALRFLLATGRRRREGMPKWSDLDMKDGRQTYVGKGEKKRTKPLSTVAMNILRGRLGHDPLWVFTFGVGTFQGIRMSRRAGTNLHIGARLPMTRGGMTSQFRRALKRSGISDLRMHDMRHTFATRLLRETNNLALVQDMLDHSDPKTTRKYAHVMESDMRRGLATQDDQPWAAAGDQVEPAARKAHA